MATDLSREFSQNGRQAQSEHPGFVEFAERFPPALCERVPARVRGTPHFSSFLPPSSTEVETLHSLSLSQSLLLAKHSVVCFGVFPTCSDKVAYVQCALKENKK